MLTPILTPRILATPFHYSVLWDPELLPTGQGVSAFPDATARRQAAYTAGRYCASRAVRRMNDKVTTAIGRRADGSPDWPAGIVGSITHTEGYASAAVGDAARCLGIGIDSEKMAEPEVLQAAQHVVVRHDEHRLFNASALSEEQTLLLLFSAKESIFKCLRPLIDRSFDYKAIRVESIQPSVFRFQLTESLHDQFSEGFCAEGRYEFSRGLVHTALELYRS